MQSSTSTNQIQENNKKPVLSYCFAGGNLAVAIFSQAVLFIIFLSSLIYFCFSITATFMNQVVIELFGKTVTMSETEKIIIIACLVIMTLVAVVLLCLYIYFYNKYYNTSFSIFDDKIIGVAYARMQKCKMDFNIPFSELEKISLVSHKLMLSHKGIIYETQITSRDFEKKLLQQINAIKI